jgi:hypothetical protein
MTNYVDRTLAPLVAQLRARYPGVRIVWAHMWPTHDGALQQVIRYQAPIKRLQALGLVTRSMIRVTLGGCTSIGDGFHLCEELDSNSRPGQWDLSIMTGAYPRETKRFSVLPARSLLRRIARKTRLSGDRRQGGARA